MGPRWNSASFLVYSQDSNSCVLGTADGIVTSRAVLRRPSEDRWSLDEAKNIKATPWDLLQRTEVEVELKPATEKLEEFEGKESRGPRWFKITKRDLEAVGCTRGCQQCEHLLNDGIGRGGLQHSERRRERVMRDIQDARWKDPSGQS